MAFHPKKTVIRSLCSLYCAHLKFKAPLTAHLQPQVQTVDVDKDAQFQCIVSGHPAFDINWLHDGKPIIGDNRIEVSFWHWFDDALCHGLSAAQHPRSAFHLMDTLSRQVFDHLSPVVGFK